MPLSVDGAAQDGIGDLGPMLLRKLAPLGLLGRFCGQRRFLRCG
jgi:hypothetical protein